MAAQRSVLVSSMRELPMNGPELGCQSVPLSALVLLILIQVVLHRPVHINHRLIIPQVSDIAPTP